MAEKETTPVANKAAKGDHDRVAMLSLRADGTPDQTPGVEIIGDKGAATVESPHQGK